MDKIELNFTIPRKLFARGVTHPINPSRFSTGAWRVARNILASILAPLFLFSFSMAMFPGTSPIIFVSGGVIGAGLVLLIWIKQHRTLMRHHHQINETTGETVMRIDATGISTRRGGIQSIITWAHIGDLIHIPDATLLPVGSSRFIIPDTALPEGMNLESFHTQLTTWKTAACPPPPLS